MNFKRLLAVNPCGPPKKKIEFSHAHCEATYEAFETEILATSCAQSSDFRQLNQDRVYGSGTTENLYLKFRLHWPEKFAVGLSTSGKWRPIEIAV
jgi:hypothetical protein